MKYIIFYTVLSLLFISQIAGQNKSHRKRVEKYTFDDSISIQQNFLNGYIDTFSIHKQKFRIKVNTDAKEADKNYVVQVLLKDGYWKNNLFFDNAGIDEKSYEIKDVDCDGFNDFTLPTSRNILVYFYDSATATFNTKKFDIYPYYQLLDTTKKIFYDIYSHNINAYDQPDINYGGQYSWLYSVKYGKCFKLEAYTDAIELKRAERTDSSARIKKMILYKYVKDGDPVKIKEFSIDCAIFNYDDFWKRHYKQLMGIKTE